MHNYNWTFKINFWQFQILVVLHLKEELYFDITMKKWQLSIVTSIMIIIVGWTMRWWILVLQWLVFLFHDNILGHYQSVIVDPGDGWVQFVYREQVIQAVFGWLCRLIFCRLVVLTTWSLATVISVSCISKWCSLKLSYIVWFWGFIP